MVVSVRGWKMITIATALVGLATFAVILRIYARFKLHIRIQTDDYLCFAALFFLYGMLVQLILCEYILPRANTESKTLTSVNKGVL